MAIATQQRPTAPVDRYSPVDLQAQYVDLIDKYVRRRVHDAQHAEDVVQNVFLLAGADPDLVQEHPLRWLIATARRECAQVRRLHLRP